MPSIATKAAIAPTFVNEFDSDSAVGRNVMLAGSL